MRVLILANIDMGLYKFRRELLEELVKTNKVYFSVPKGEFVESIKKIGCKYVPCDLMNRHGTNPLTELKLINYYKKIIKKIKPSIVLTYTIKPNVYGGLVCSLLKVPYVVNITGLGTAVENGGLLQFITLTLYRIGLCKAQKIFFQNTENKDFMISRGVVKQHYDLLPGSGVNLSQYDIQPYPDGDTVDFVFIARVMKEKGIDQYLDAAKYIKKRHPETRFHICGFCEQDYEDILEKLNDNGTIIYHGLVSDMLPIYKMASCIVHPTYYPEGLSNVLLEASASGRPIITTDRAGCREVVENEVNGFIANQKDSRDLISKIECFLSLSKEIRCKMGQAGRAKIEKEFDRKIVVNKYMREVKKAGKNGL